MRRIQAIVLAGLLTGLVLPAAAAGPGSTIVAGGPGEHRILPDVCAGVGLFEVTIDLADGTARLVGESTCPLPPDTLAGCHETDAGAIECPRSTFPGHDSRLLLRDDGRLFYESRQTGAFVNVTADTTILGPAGT